MAIKKWGPDRCRFAYAWKSLLNAGIPIQFGSDAPVEPINPLLGFQEAATRHPLDEALSDRWFPSKTLTVDECIRAFTCQPAWTSRKENHLGILTPGRWADLTVYKQDFFNRSPDQWSGVTVDMTIVDGEIVYQP